MSYTTTINRKCEPEDVDKMAVLIRIMRGIACFELTLEVLRLAPTTFEDLVALLIEKDRRNKQDKDMETGIDRAFASSRGWKGGKKLQCRYCNKRFG